MAKRKTVEQQIAEAEAKIQQEQNNLKKFQSQQKEQDRKARNHRLCKRHGQLESLLPDIATLTDEQFKHFLEQHIANKHGRRMLEELVVKGADNAAPKTAEPSADSTAPKTGAPAAQPSTPATSKSTESEQSVKPTAPAEAEQHSGSNPSAAGRSDTVKAG